MSSRPGVAVAVIGASGNVGRKIIELLIQRNLVEPECLQLYASKKSNGKKINIADHEWIIHDVDAANFKDIQLALFATDSDVSEKYIPDALKSGAIVVDSSSLYRLDAEVPLIVSPVNKHLVSVKNIQLYAMANCVSSPISTVIAPLHRKHKIHRVTASTYQSVSGAGKGAMDELLDEMRAVLAEKEYERKHFQRQIAFNVIPQIDRMLEDGFTYEEYKIMREIQKIVGGDFGVTATSVRVPVMVGHSVSLGIEFDKEVSVDEIKSILERAPSVQVCADFKTPIEIVNSDQVYAGRIRKDPSADNAIQMWICSDNLRRGAATDMVEVAEEILKQLKEKVA